MTTSNYITFILLAVIGLVFLIDFILNSRKKPLEKSVEKFVEKESGKQEGFFNRFLQKINLVNFFWVYPISFLVFWIFLFAAFSLDGGFSGAFVDIKREFIQYDDIGFLYHQNDWVKFMFPLWVILGVFHLFWFVKKDFGNWILERKKNFTLSVLLISLFKLLTHFFLYRSNINKPRHYYVSDIGPSHRAPKYGWGEQEFTFHLESIYSHEVWLFIPVTIIYLVVVWFFNDKIKAK